MPNLQETNLSLFQVRLDMNSNALNLLDFLSWKGFSDGEAEQVD